MGDMTIEGLLADYRAGTRKVRDVVAEALAEVRRADARNVWITVLDDVEIERYLARLEGMDPGALPLYGVPFAIKDNIDLAGVPTTAGCPEYAYVPERSAFVVQCLIDAGAVPLGKTNLDQFATGLVGARSPYGACGNAFNPEYIAGGSSSGSAVAVALGQVSFSLGTDTAGSGRVPAAFNNLIGVKPTRGLLSAAGVVPACRTLDTVSIFALDAPDAMRVLAVTAVHDPADPYARKDRVPALGLAGMPVSGFRFGVPAAGQLQFFGDRDYQALFAAAVQRLKELGGEAVEINLSPFLEAARLLYEGPWVAERYAAIRDFFDARPEALVEVTREIIGGGKAPLAVHAFEAQYRLQGLRARAETIWDTVDLVLTPTAGTIPTIAAVQAEPVRVNSDLGYYTNFMNLLDLCAVAVPAGLRADGLPFGVTLFAPAFRDRELLPIADRLQRAAGLLLGATGRPAPDLPALGPDMHHCIPVAVCGAHMSGLPLNHQLTERQARLVQTTRTAPEYRFYALPGGPPERPGLIRVGADGGAIELEVWLVPSDRFGSFVAGIPAPLGIGRVRLEDGSEVPGFLCESVAISDATDITDLGSWRRFLATRA
ncbi:allophanate hydrolase [Thioalkalivibrio sp.]|uniref:allophanate hydrolase n=1 Tax=Thioalkalivibrio sp. TaxID=2093813 RepID=UPI003975C40B